MFQTIKCLLIVPNAESALNEEAGKMLLEHYDDYSKRAKLMTEIHARPTFSTSGHSDEEAGHSSKKLASEKKTQDKKKEKLMKEKRKILKRL